jgi:hypothetical protein
VGGGTQLGRGGSWVHGDAWDGAAHMGFAGLRRARLDVPSSVGSVGWVDHLVLMMDFQSITLGNDPSP